MERRGFFNANNVFGTDHEWRRSVILKVTMIQVSKRKQASQDHMTL